MPLLPAPAREQPATKMSAESFYNKNTTPFCFRFLNKRHSKFRRSSFARRQLDILKGHCLSNTSSPLKCDQNLALLS